MAVRRRMGFLIFFIFRGVRLVLPIMRDVIIFIFRLMLTAVASFIVGIPEATDRMAREQEDRVMRSGRLPTAYAIYFYWVVRTLAILIVVAGWICFSFTTVFIVMLII